jgi:SAM-dependent methyltransferase
MRNVTTWREFWERPNSIYVCEQHRVLHGHLIADSIVRFIRSPAATVLDYGCGEALAADSMAAHCAKLLLCDTSRSLRSALEKRHAGHGKIKIIAPTGVQALPKNSLDLIVLNSVIQYLSRAELERLLDLFRTRLRDSGTLVIGDVIPPTQSKLADAISLLRFGFDGGFVSPALLGLAKLFFSDYRRLRAEVGLSIYTEADVIGILESKGFEAERSGRNIGHNQARFTLQARKMKSSQSFNARPGMSRIDSSRSATIALQLMS